METSKYQNAGVNRAHGRSVAQKSAFAIGHFAIVLICAWLIYGNGWGTVGQVFGKTWQLADNFRAQVWIIGIPLIMGCTFVFFHIPGLDSYLAERYGDEFRIYSEKTKKFIPFVY